MDFNEFIGEAISGMVGYILFGIAVRLVINWFVAREFELAARGKGYTEKKYFWISFLLGEVGWLLVIALPNKGAVQAVSQEPSAEELPEL